MTSVGTGSPDTLSQDHRGLHRSLQCREVHRCDRQAVRRSGGHISEDSQDNAQEVNATERTLQTRRFGQLHQDNWYGPARVLSSEGTSSMWLVHGGVTILVAETDLQEAGAGVEAEPEEEERIGHWT